MHRVAVFFALPACSGCQPGASTPEDAGHVRAVSSSALTSSLTNRVWARSDSTGLPGVMRIFLSNGTLMLDSCWETYRLAQWQMESDSTVLWQEDGMDIRAGILEVSDDALVLRLDLVSGSEEERYAAASVPYVCPDMRR